MYVNVVALPEVLRVSLKTKNCYAHIKSEEAKPCACIPESNQMQQRAVSVVNHICVCIAFLRSDEKHNRNINIKT